jgi:anti-sigma factor RsiW
MHDPWTDRLSEYIDGGLAPNEAQALERHLVTCDVCAATHAELRQVVGLARSLEAPPPERDLWTGIAAAIAVPVRPGGGHDAGVVPLRVGRRVTFSMPQLAAAAMLLMALGGGAVWLLVGGSAGTGSRAGAAAQGVIMRSATATDARLVSTPLPSEQRYESDVARLEQALEQARDRLDPATVEIVERSLESIDEAIADARAALDADPGNPHLHWQLESTMQKKLALLRRASGQRVGT